MSGLLTHTSAFCRQQFNNSSQILFTVTNFPETEQYWTAKCVSFLSRIFSSGVGVSLKVGDKYWEDWRGGVWGGAVPSQLGVWGLAPRKKNQFCAKNYAILSKIWYFFPILQQKVGGGIIPSPESGGPIPLLRRLWFSVAWVGKDLFKASRFSVKTIKTEDWLWAFTNQLPHRGSSVLAIFLGKYKLLTNFTHALRHYNNNEILTLSPVFYLENFHKFYLNVENVATSKHVTCICTTICQFRPIFFYKNMPRYGIFVAGEGNG